LQPEALRGPLGELIGLIEPHTEADPAGIALQFLTGFGSAVGRHAGFRVEADRHYPNLYVCLVGETSKGRKGVSLSQALRPLALADPDWHEACIATGLSSGEGLIHAVRDPTWKGGKESDEEPLDAGVPDKRLLVVEQEFASPLRVMRREGNTLAAVLRSAWDTGHLRVLTKNSPTRATNAHVSVITHITREELQRELTQVDAANGFANRFLFVCVKRSKQLPEGGRLNPEKLAPFGRRFQSAIEMARSRGPLNRGKKAKARWAEIYNELSAGRRGLVGAVTARAEAQVMRLVVLYALLEEDDKIGVGHLEAGLAVWRYCEESAAYLFCTESGDRHGDRILAALSDRPKGMTRMEVRQLFGGHISRADLDEALEYLEEEGLVETRSEKTGGRPKQRWIALGKKKSKSRKSGHSRDGRWPGRSGGNA